MAVSVNIDPQDVSDAANFLEQYLGDAVPTGDYTSGTALRDLTIGALASIFAFLRADATQIRQMQSLNTVQAATGGDQEALADAVTAILSNVFIKLKGGTKAQGVGTGHASQLTDIFIMPTHRFTYASGIVFVVNSPTTYFIPQTDLIPIVDANNVVLEYQFRIPLIAVDTGLLYNIDPGLFASFDRFNPFITKVEATEKFSNGNGAETVQQVLTRAPTALSVRNLINNRSITAVLDDNFPDIHAILVVGYGDPEMQRDRLSTSETFMKIHLGGHVDIYLLLDFVETSFTGTVGGLFERPDGVICMFRDSNTSFAGIEEGDVLRIVTGLPLVPLEFLIIENLGTSLVIDPRVPFPLATDEANPVATVSYTIGRVSPAFNDVLSGLGGTPIATGSTSRQVAHSGRITLPGGPVMDILDVAILNPANSEAAFVSPVDGYEHFPNHVNGVPNDNATPIQGLQYVTVVNNPLAAQSNKQWMEIVVGTDTRPARFDGLSLRVRYRTLAGFDGVDAFVAGRDERTVAANQLVRGHNPIEVMLDIQYELSSAATALLDNSVIAQSVVDLINQFDTTVNPIDVSAITTFLRSTYPTMSAILPLTIHYALRAPTGDLIGFTTTDVVIIDPSKKTSGPTLDLLGLAVSSRTVRYLANTLDVTAVQVS